MTTTFEGPPAVEAARRPDRPGATRLRALARAAGGVPGVAGLVCC
jgi:hypothetical protein